MTNLFFLEPRRKTGYTIFPYAEHDEHWIVGILYKWDEDEEDSARMVSDIEVVVQPKWKLASKSTATGTTTHIGSIKDIDRLKRGDGVFESEKKFEEFWREKGGEGGPEENPLEAYLHI